MAVDFGIIDLVFGGMVDDCGVINGDCVVTVEGYDPIIVV